MKKLKADDRCAVDLLLEQRNRGSGEGWEQCFNRSGSAAFQKRIALVERLFESLDLMPVQEPPANLVAKTLKHIQRAEARHAVTNEAVFTAPARAAFQRSLH